MKMPEGISKLTNLLTLTGIHGGGDIPLELGKLRQLRSLGVMDVTEDTADALFASITRLQKKLTLLDTFSPPHLLRKLRLEGRLENIPSWFHSLNNLTMLRLGFSHLEEDPALALQQLPNLQNLTLWHAYDGNLQYLHFHNCSRLRMLPEGLQFVTTLKQLDLLPLNDDHVERLKPDGGEENYKIEHIPTIRFLPVSALKFSPPN
ncbi:unnamed protein product [Linum tenue]|uniref:Disease resistance R13L4/SHOC-2-like LRR domain-containing protein n=1 Tax=Linum tenue TaxID=586396 RepID=A0AAV0IDE1_9ROSI|nr:unnamed protein product [Linum tenue]